MEQMTEQEDLEMASWQQQVHLMTLSTSHLDSRKELRQSVWGDLWPQGRSRGTCPSSWPPRGCGDKVRKDQVTKTGVTMERESQLRRRPSFPIPFSLLWGVGAEIC